MPNKYKSSEHHLPVKKEPHAIYGKQVSPENTSVSIATLPPLHMRDDSKDTQSIQQPLDEQGAYCAVNILYSPHTNNKNTPAYNQKGNDCWYYASKMTMRFFDSTNKDSYFHKELILAAKKSRIDRDNYMKNDRTKLSSAFSNHFGKVVTNQEEYYFKAGFKKIGTVFENYRIYTIDRFFSLLSERGPLLASGQYGKPVHMMAPLRRNTFELYSNTDGENYRLKVSDYSGGNHAISIWGVSIEDNCVFYSDPNYSFLDKILQVDFDLFKKRLDSLYYFDHPYAFASKTRSLATFKEV